MIKKGLILISLALLFGVFSQILICSAENTAQNLKNPNPIMTFFEQTTSNPILKIIGINETASFKEIAITILLIIIAISLLFWLTDFTELVPGKLLSLLISTIIVLAGSYKGFIFNIARQIITAPKTILELLKNPIFWIIIGIVILILIFSPWIKKTIIKEKEASKNEKINKRLRKREMLEKIKDYETNIELKRYGANPQEI